MKLIKLTTINDKSVAIRSDCVVAIQSATTKKGVPAVIVTYKVDEFSSKTLWVKETFGSLIELIKTLEDVE